MNSLIIILIFIILIVIFYFIYQLFRKRYYLINAVQNLQKSSPSISVSKIDDPASTRYAYSIWIYVNSWNNSANKVIISRYNDIVLFLDSTTSTLKCKLNPKYSPDRATAYPIDPSKITNADSKSPFINITNNFPLQKWVNITVSIDNNIFDAYLDGKLVKSLQITQVNPDRTSDLYLGNGYDAFITRLSRFNHPLDPQSAWNIYLKGNGSNSAFGLFGNNKSNYSANLTIYQNNVETKNIKLL